MRQFIQFIPPLLMTAVAVSAAALLKFFVHAEFGLTGPYLIFFSAIAISAVFGGFLQGVIAVVASALIVGTFFLSMTPLALLSSAQDLVQLLMFFVDGLLVAGIGGFAYQTNLRAQVLLGEARKSERLSKANDFRFRRVYESNMLGLLIARQDGRIVEANEYFLRMLGYTKNEFQLNPLNWRQLTPPESLPSSEKAWEAMNEEGVTEPIETEFYDRDGNRVQALLGSAFLDAETAVSFVLDIRSRKEVENKLATAYEQLEARVEERTLALRESESFLESIIENIPNMIFIKDAVDLKFVRFNKAGENLLGYPRSELLGKNDRDFFPPEQAENFIEFDRRVLQERSIVDIPEEPISTKSGVRYLHTMKIPVFDDEGRPRYLLGISEDITEKKALERDKVRLLEEQGARREAEKNAKQLEFLSEAGAALGESLEVKQVLETFCHVVTKYFADCCMIDLLSEDGVDFQELIVSHRDPKLGPLIREFRKNHPVDWNEPRGIANVVRTGKAELIRDFPEERLRSAIADDDFYEQVRHYKIESLITVPLKLYGRILGTITCVSYDAAHIYDDVDLAVVFELAKRVSIAMENSRLYSSAENANRAKSAFLANMSHEIRTPLGAMLGFAELISDGELSEEQKLGVSTIVRNGKQLLRIVDEILDLSKVESERIHIEEIDFDLRQLIQDVLALLDGQAKDRKLTLSAEVHPDLPRTVRSDPTRLRQILINVIGNAIKFTSAGFVRVGIHPVMDSSALGRTMLEISVSDTGIGLSKEQASRLFQPFAQADESTTRRFGGTGLGLFLSRKLSRLLGGDLVLEWSQPGEGSHFVATVELRPPARIQTQVSPTVEASVDQESAKAHILIVDDAPDNRTLISRYISKSGYVFQLAENGAEGVEKALSQKFDLILMDIQMPEMDGFEAVRRLRERGYEKPIIALTAHAMKGDRELCLSKGFSDYLSKPIHKEDLLRVMQMHLTQDLEKSDH